MVLGLGLLAMIAATIVIRHVYFYDDFAELTIAAGLPAPPPFPDWQRIALAGIACLAFLGGIGMLFRRSWGVYLFLIGFLIGQTFAFSIGQWGLPSFLTGFVVVILGMNFLSEMK